MLITERRVQLPTGEGGRLNRLANERWPERLVELVPVKNKVIWVNPNFPNLPFDLQLNQESPLGLFAKTTFSEESAIREMAKGSQVGECWPEDHKRSALLGRMLLGDNAGRIYRDIDLKGTGFVSDLPPADSTTSDRHELVVGGKSIQSWYRRDGAIAGLLDMESATYNRDRSEDFYSLGIETSRTLAIIELLEIVLDGNIVSVDALKKKNGMPQDFNPVIEVRAFTTKARIRDYLTENKRYSERNFLEDAKAIVSQKLKLDKKISDSEYIMHFAEMLGKNIGLMHKNGWTHGFLNPHNIALDGSIVDLDSVDSLTDPNEQRSDLIGAEDSFLDFLRAISRESELGAAHMAVVASYLNTFPLEEQIAYFDGKRAEMLAGNQTLTP